MRNSRPGLTCAAIALALALPVAARAQLGGLGLPSTGGLPSAPLPLPDARDLPRLPADELRRRAAGPLADLRDQLTEAIGETRRQLADRLIRENPRYVEADPHGEPVVRGEILALAPSPEALAAARAAGFGVRGRETLPGLDLETVTLTAPRGMAVAEAMRRLRQIAPDGQFDFNHLYQPSGAAAAGGPTPAGGATVRAAGLRVGLVDGSVAASHPAFRGVRVVQQTFAPGGARVSAHATAVGSLIAGASGRFRGAAPGATLMVADVYGPTPAGGSAQAIARGLGWLAQTRTPVIDISLVGPQNLVLAAAVRQLIARGHIIVAAVGNDGPAAPPLYPASYPGVVAVTAVDASRRVLPEAGRGGHVDFAAPGAQMAAASISGGYVTVRGTSFAAPIAAGELARLLPQPDPGRAAQAIAALAQRADDLGARGVDPVYGRGLIGFAVRTDPAAVGARAVALRGP